MRGQTSGYVITTLASAPVSGNLTSLAHVKDELDISESDTLNDTRLARFIAEESAGIARYCNRVFGLAMWQDEFRPQRGLRSEGVRGATNPLQLSWWPLAEGAVALTGNTHSSKLVDGLASTSSLTCGMPIYGAGIAAGAVIASVMQTSVMLSVPATATASGVALTAGLSVTETAAGVSTALVAGTDFEIDMGSRLPGDEGVAHLYRLNERGEPRTWPAARIVVVYRAGYSLADASAPNVPTDLESACIRLVVGRFRARSRDPMLVEQSQPGGVGTQRYWVGATPGQSGPYPNEIMATLEKYRVPVIA